VGARIGLVNVTLPDPWTGHPSRRSLGNLCGYSGTSAHPAGQHRVGDDGRTLALELLLRLWQRSEEGPLQRAAGEASLLLVELPLELMSEQLPLLKANWISGGETAMFLSSLEGLAIRAWRITIAKYEPVSFIAWP
jgi:hypothetical protein